MKFTVVLALLLSVITQAGQAQNTKTFNKKMKFWLSWYHIPGAQVVFIKNGEIANAFNYGSITYKGDRKVVSSTKFQVGKANQILTGLALMREISNKNINKYKSVNDQIYGYKLRNSILTRDHKTLPSQLLNHSGGINRPYFSPLEKDIEISTLDLLKGSKLTGKKKIHNFQTPLKSYLYSEGGYVLARYLIEENAKQDFIPYLSEHILPELSLDLNLNAFSISKGKRAKGYLYSKWEAEDALKYPNPSGFGMWLSGKEYAGLILQIFEDQDLPRRLQIKEKEYQSFTTPSIKIKDTPFSSCSVFEKHDYEKGIYRLKHTRDGFRSVMYYDSEAKEGFILLLNSESDYMFRRYEDKLFNKFIKFSEKYNFISLFSKMGEN